MKNIAFRQAVGALEIERRQNLPRQDRARQIRRVLARLFSPRGRPAARASRPTFLPQLVRHILNKARHHVLPGRRERANPHSTRPRNRPTDPREFRRISQCRSSVSANSSEGTSVKSDRCDFGHSRGMPLTLGSSLKTKFTFAHGPSILMPATARRKSAGSSLASTKPRNVRFGSAFESTKRDWKFPCRLRAHTPRARPLRASIFATGADVTISAPSFRGRRSQRLRDRAHPADHVSVKSLNLAVAAAQ